MTIKIKINNYRLTSNIYINCIYNIYNIYNICSIKRYISNMTTTLITALYNIGRDNLTGKNAHRSFTKYLNWFKHVLSINVPMVIFIPPDLVYYVKEHRNPQYQTNIIIRNFEDLAAYKYYDKIQNIINNMTREPNSDGSFPSYFTECPEFITAKYETIIFSKFDFLKEVSHENPFNTEYFIWLDAGTFYQEPPFNNKLEWPDPYKIRILRDRFLISNYDFNVNDTSPLSNKRSYLRLNRNEICAYILGGNYYAINLVHHQFWNEVENAINMGVINNEQHFLQLMALERPEYYYIWYQTRYQYPNMPIPLKDRMIPCELAIGTFIKENYPINQNIKLLAVATKEISPSSYQRWESTAIHYGYDYDIIGRDRKWEGFGSKIRLFHESLKNITTPYVVLTDCTDVFMCGSSDELYDKFIAENKDLIIGGEMKIYYPGGKYDRNTMIEFFSSIKQSPQSYPNSGFIMGKTHQVLELMKSNLEYEDDQGACFDAIYEGRTPMVIDYKTNLIGNVPNYGPENYRSVEYFKFNPIIRRYENSLHKTTPTIFHFPGKNWETMNNFFLMTESELISGSTENNAGWIFLIILISFAIFLLIIYFWSKYYL